MNGIFDHDPWGEIPDWAQSDSEQSYTSDENSKVAAHIGRNGPISIPGAQHTIILIDSHLTMFEPCIRTACDYTQEGCISPFDAAIIAAENIIHYKVHLSATTRTGKRDGIGIILYNCPSARTESDTSSSIRTLMSLNPPGVDSIHMIRACSKNKDRCDFGSRDLKNELYSTKVEETSDDADSFEDKFEISQAYSLRSALYEANDMFNEAKCVKKLSSTAKEVEDAKVVWIFTNESDPSKGNEEQKCSVQCTVKDLLENGIYTRLWSLPRVDKMSFDRTLFYDYIITDDENDPDKNSLHAETQDDLNLEGLLEKVSEAFMKVRKLQTIPMQLPDWEGIPKSCRYDDSEEMANNATYPGIMINLYHVIRIKKKPLPTYINSRTRKRTNRVTEILSTETGELISRDRIRHHIEFGNERIYFTKDEIDRIKLGSNANSIEPCLNLFGFKPAPSMSSIVECPLLNRSMFAYPDEAIVKGNRVAFASLHSSMVRKRVMGIGKLLYKTNGTTRFVAIIPQEESLFENGEQIRPPGFIIIPLAFEDDIRAIPDSEGIVLADMDLVETAENMIRHLNLDRQIVIGESFENPALKIFWNYIESVALGTPLSEKLLDDDDTSWDVKNILSACGQHIDKFKKLLPENEHAVAEKKRKSFQSDSEVVDIDWITEFNQNTLDTLSVNQLKLYLRSKGEPTAGRKSDLIAKIKRHISAVIGDEGNKV